MLRPLPLVSVGQQHGQSAKPVPLILATGNKLIDNHLGAVGEVAKLRLPDHEAAGGRGGIAIFESQYRFFGQKRIIDSEGRLLRTQLLQGHIRLAISLIVKHRMSMAEGAAPHVLACQTDGIALLQ